jgi:hypothetical protein
VAGTLCEYHYNPQTGALECRWQETGQIAAPSRVYLPGWLAWDRRAVKLAPAGEGFEVAAAGPGSQSVYLTIPPAGGPCERHLAVAL